MDLMLYEQIEEKYKDDIAKVMRYLWIMWGGAFSALPVLVIVSIVLGGRLQQQIEGSDVPLEILIPVFSVFAISSLLAAFILRKQFLSGKMNNYLKRTQRSKGVETPDFVVFCKGGLFLPAAVSSTPAVVGFPLFALGASVWVFYVFVIIGALGMIYHRPQKDVIIEFIVNEQKEEKITNNE